MPARLNHLVLLADTLADGARWCQAALGATPHPGGTHPALGTHSLLLPLHTAPAPAAPAAIPASAYLEIIAIHPQAHAPRHPRWHGMDDARLRQQVRTRGPLLIHWAARVPCIAQAALDMARLEADCGEILHTHYPAPPPGRPPAAAPITPPGASPSAASGTPPTQAMLGAPPDTLPGQPLPDLPGQPDQQGLHELLISVPPNGQRPFGGCLPSLIQWLASGSASAHSHWHTPPPVRALPPAALTLGSLTLRHPQAQTLAQACASLALPGLHIQPARASALIATLHTPQGLLTLPCA